MNGRQGDNETRARRQLVSRDSREEENACTNHIRLLEKEWLLLAWLKRRKEKGRRKRRGGNAARRWTLRVKSSALLFG